MKLKVQIFANWRLILAALVVLCAFQAFPSASYGFELFGLYLFGKKTQIADPDTVDDPKYYQLDLEAPNDDEATFTIIKAASALYADRDKPASGTAGLIAKARADYRRLLAALYAEGYYGSLISITLNGREAADFELDDNLPDPSNIIINVDKGALYHFERATITPAVPADKNKERRKQKGAFASGEVARSNSILQAESDALEAWQNQGFAKPQLIRREVVADHQTHQIAADIEIAPGEITHYGEIDVRNNSTTPRVNSAYVIWMSGLKQGQIYNQQQIKRSQRRLARLEVFRSHSIDETAPLQPDATLPLSINVEERPPRRFGVGAAYSTLDGAGFESYWLHRNLLGQAERLRFDAKISGIGAHSDNSFHPENYSYMLGSNFIRPGIFTPDTDFIANLKLERELLDNYTATGLYLQSGINHIFSDELLGQSAFTLSHIRSKDDYFGTRNFTLVGLGSTLTYDSRNEKNDATSGYYAQFYFEPFYETKFGNFITKSTIERRLYYPIDDQQRLIVAGRLKLGSITGAPIEDLPNNIVFFAGGGGSVRGYGYRNIGITTPDNKIIGGRSLIEASGEARLNVTQTIGVVGFVDGGQVGSQPYPDFSQNVKWGAGLGFRYKTGLGPIRVDVARPFDGKKGDPDLGLYIGIGQAF